MQRTIYLSPSNHGVGVNKCLHTGCYEDKHTRPMANEAARHLKTSGFSVIVADENRGVVGRCQDANRLGVDLYIPIHTNAAAPQYRYLLAMAWDPNNKDTARLYDCFKQTMGATYNGSIQLWKRRNLIEINTPKMLSFYIEAGFHTNQQDCDDYIHNAKARGKELAQMICMFYGVEFKSADEEPKPVDKKVILEDGVWGVSTTKYTQKLLKTVEDGIVSSQLSSCKKYLPSAHTGSWEFKTFAKGSAMIIALQKYVGLTGKQVDGLAGKTTVIALQQFLNKKGLYTGAIDGIMGYGTVIAWQKFINSQF